jgi:hypothetical protein
MTTTLILAVIAIAAASLCAYRMSRSRRYDRLLEECVERQPHHEREHGDRHPERFTAALRLEAVARRFQRKIHQAGLRPLSDAELRLRAMEAICRQGG